MVLDGQGCPWPILKGGGGFPALGGGRKGWEWSAKGGGDNTLKGGGTPLPPVGTTLMDSQVGFS